MRDLSNLVDNFNPLGTHKLERNIDPIVRKLVDQVFAQLEAIFPANYKNVFSSEEKVNASKKEWVKSFFENNVNNIAMIAVGIKKARAVNTGFLPTTGQFVTWCKSDSEDNGHSFDRFIERKQPKDYAEHVTRHKIGYKCRTQLPEEKARKLWGETIDRIRSRIASGEITPPDPNAVQIESPAEMKKKLTPDQRNQQLDRQIDEMLAGNVKLIGPFKKRYLERAK